MEIKPNYSYEFNCILNPEYNDDEQIKNFASLISDKDRFLPLVKLIEHNSKLIEKCLGYELKPLYDFFVVRCEKFKSFSLPITIEYSILPEEMIVYLLKEIIKISIEDRFVDTMSQEKYVNCFVDYLLINGDWKGAELIKFSKNLHEDALKKHPKYEFEELDFSKKTMRDYVYSFYEN